ncbi:Tat pathway signal protein [Streptomyces sp. H27-H1]|uniref:Tat pathway signal protein n=1 Tax=Streptomyces sp. H27-H1 TaxID=2996461 RepID=UPI00226F8A16|nr:Tat pathway signal protein [Streptomyces sp. H27-H1]MCY0932117.1 Tat pathway signal protein [Streptomyces sp. H27-H1]
MARERNTLLASVIAETGWSQRQLAAAVARVATETGAGELAAVRQSHVSMWVGGTRPEPRAGSILCETLSRRLNRTVTPAHIGLAPPTEDDDARPAWDIDTATALADFGDSMTMNRRTALSATAYSAAGAALPPPTWWDQTRDSARTRTPRTRLTVTAGHVAAIQDAGRFYSGQDQRLGGGAGRTALAAYLQTDVAAYLAGHFPSEQVRRDLFTAAAELVYLAGWTSFDTGDHAVAQRQFGVALRLAAEADAPALAGHILRAAAHQAVDLHHPRRALELAEGSMAERRYKLATPRERALLGVVHARALAISGQKKEALAALTRASADLAAADPGIEEPGRVGFFAEASLAHESACTLRDLGDLQGAETAFRHSVRTRALPYARTFSVTLGYLGQVQAGQGHLDDACETWNRALDAMAGIRSGRARDTVVQMRRSLSPVKGRGGSTATDLDQRAREFLAHVV